VWVGTRQQHLGPRVFGLLLQVAAGLAFGVGGTRWGSRGAGALPIVNSEFIGALLIALGGLVTARMLARAPAITAHERRLVAVAFAWGVLWWLASVWHEIERFVAVASRIPLLVAVLAATALAFAAVARRANWTLARVPALALPLVLFVVAVYRVADMAGSSHLLGAAGAVAWPFALAIEIALLRHFDRVSPPVPAMVLDVSHALLAWLLTLAVAHELAWLARAQGFGAAWRTVPWGLVPAIAVLAIARGVRGVHWPIGTRRFAWLVIGAAPLAAAMLAWTLYANVATTGDAAPLPFVPLVNPLDIGQGFVVVALARWLQQVRALPATPLPAVSAEAIGAAAAALLLFWVTFATLRTLHHWADVPWSFPAIWSSRLVQVALSLLWSVFALAAMVVAHRRRYRGAWVAGAALLAVVVAKLFFVDLSQAGGVERIVSFMGVGVLMLIVGYVAPVPPRTAPS
jgi:hypothetical protein